MRLPRFRLTVRWLMIGVALLATCLGVERARRRRYLLGRAEMYAQQELEARSEHNSLRRALAEHERWNEQWERRGGTEAERQTYAESHMPARFGGGSADFRTRIGGIALAIEVAALTEEQSAQQRAAYIRAAELPWPPYFFETPHESLKRKLRRVTRGTSASPQP